MAKENEKIVLDALIIREDFEIEAPEKIPQSDNKTTLSIQDLELNSFFFSALRKPDFQRETNEWDSEKTLQFIQSFINGDLIPSIILWKNSSNIIFVIDGSHRLSALAAWINDDYGDGKKSLDFFDNNISNDQKFAAENTRKLINEIIGPYSDYSPQNMSKASMEQKIKILNLGSLAIQIQWVRGDSSKAEESFFKINEKATPIDSTEKKLIKSRNKATGIASRAIIRSGTGHNYWSTFSDNSQKEIKKLATDIHKCLFEPNYQTPIKTLNLPVAGKVLSNQGLALVYNTVNLCNGIPLNKEKDIDDDTDGVKTIKYLKNTLKYLNRITGTHPGSLGFHPAVYFYSMRGAHKIASYYGILEFIIHLEKTNKFSEFTLVRKSFEEALLKYENLIQQIVRKHRQSTNSYKNIKEYYITIMDKLTLGIPVLELPHELKKEKIFNYLKIEDESETEDDKSQKNFSKEIKANIYFDENLKSISRCPICGGYISLSSVTIDHIIRVQDGGKGNLKNGQLVHPYCNSTLKN